MSEPIRKRLATVMTNADLISVRTYSAYRLAFSDPTAEEYLLPPDATDDALGAAVLGALARSRFLTIEESAALRANAAERYATWVNNLMSRYGYKNKNALLMDMKNCSVEGVGEVITIKPTHHEKLEAWSGDGITQGDYIVIAAHSPATEVGVALRHAFQRCT